MSKIKILPEILSNKIAAGEVVERPASVVKELVENSLDAGSTRIIIEVGKGGRGFIRVSDNGSGMNRDDALLAMERYGTSKIYDDRDLFSINTLGFRGEALPSIASVAKFTLVTRDSTSETGTEINIEGGKIKKVSQRGAPIGTMVAIRQLFYNTPARRKFLKTINTEMGHVVETTASMALGRPDVHFELNHDNRTVKNWSKTQNAINRTVDVLGRAVINDLYPVEKKSGDLTLSGWISSPVNSRSTNKGIYVFVNGRFVRDRIIQHALFEGYGQRLMKGRFPLAVLYLNLPFDQVDVNVHPTKSEVRFARHREIHDVVKETVLEVVNRIDRSKWLSNDIKGNEKTDKPQAVSESLPEYETFKKACSHSVRGNRGNSTFSFQSRLHDKKKKHAKPGDKRQESIISKTSGIDTPLISPDRPHASDHQPVKEKTGIFSDLMIIGQIHNTYIICEYGEGLVVVDQHAAHERIVYEQLRQRSDGLANVSQKLIIPETFDLGYREAEIIEKMIPDLLKLGLEIESFGGSTYIIKAVPALLAEREIKPVVIEIIENMTSTGFSPGIEKTMDECVILMACHSAIRAGQSLSIEQMKDLMKQLDRCENPSHCPHGRPIWIHWTSKSLEKLFKRII